MWHIVLAHQENSPPRRTCLLGQIVMVVYSHEKRLGPPALRAGSTPSKLEASQHPLEAPAALPSVVRPCQEAQRQGAKPSELPGDQGAARERQMADHLSGRAGRRRRELKSGTQRGSGSLLG